MRKILLCGLLAAVPTACTDSVNIKDFSYGAGQPGHGLVHGGEVFLELIHSPTGDLGQLNGWAREFSTEPSVADSLPIPVIPPNTCMDLTTPVFPRPPTVGSEFLDLGPQLTVSTDTVTTTAMQKADFTDNLQYGIPMGYQNQPFDATTIVHDATYTVAFTGSESLTPNTMFFSPIFQIFSPTIGTAPVTFTHGQPVDISWDPVNQGAPNDNVQTVNETFPFVIILGPAAPTTGQVKWFCPMNDGKIHDSFSIPAEVVDALPPMGTLVMGQQTHMMATFTAPDSVTRRFDLITIECNRSPFSFAP